MNKRKQKLSELEKNIDFLFNRWITEDDKDFKQVYANSLYEMEQQYKELNNGKYYHPKELHSQGVQRNKGVSPLHHKS
jgi:hypothetical protein